ncbi:MAG: DUF4440 domain-containing protein, partial [Thermomicrobiales bacterium]
EQWLDRYRSGGLRHDAFIWSEARYRVFGDTAVAIGRQTQTSTMQDRDVSGEFRVTHVFARDASSWRLVSAHFSPIAGAPAR